MKRKTILLFISIILMSFIFKVEAQTQKAVNQTPTQKVAVKPDPISPPELVAPMEGTKINVFPVKPSLSGNMLKVQANMKLRLNTVMGNGICSKMQPPIWFLILFRIFPERSLEGGE